MNPISNNTPFSHQAVAWVLIWGNWTYCSLSSFTPKIHFRSCIEYWIVSEYDKPISIARTKVALNSVLAQPSWAPPKIKRTIHCATNFFRLLGLALGKFWVHYWLRLRNAGWITYSRDRFCEDGNTV